MNPIDTALVKLSRLFKVDLQLLMALPVRTYQFAGVAYISPTEIAINSDVVLNDPMNVEVYLAHEIFHYVVHDVGLTHLYSANVLNDAEDYIINYLLYLHYGLDVRKVKYAGLYRASYGKLGLSKLAKRLSKKLDPDPESKFVNTLGNPYISKIAHTIRKNLGYAIPPRLIKPSEHDNSYFTALLSDYADFFYGELCNVDPEIATYDLWSLFYHSQVEYDTAVLGRTLTHTQALVLSPLIPEDTVGDAALSMFATRKLVNLLNNSTKFLISRINVLDQRVRARNYALYYMNHDLNSTHKKRARKRLKERIEAYEKRVVSLQKKISYLSDLTNLRQNFIDPCTIKVRPTPSTLSSITFAAIQKPRINTRNEVVRKIRAIQKLFFNIDEIKELLDGFNEATKGFAGMGESEEPSTENTAESGENESEDDGGSGPSDKSGAGGTDLHDEAKSNASAKSKLSVLTTLDANSRILKMILKNSIEFGEKLVTRPTSRISELGLKDKTITLGNDLSRVDYAELGKLKNKYTKLSFLVDFANSNLLQYSDLDSRRPPLILVLDCSGIMVGKHYAIAAGFVLCMIKKLQSVNRSCALIKFSGKVDESFVFTGGKADLAKLLTALATPSYGGTEFDTALLHAFDIHKQQNWIRSQIILITDAGGKISADTMLMKPTSANITAVITTTKSKITGIDDCVNIRQGQLGLELVNLGNKYL
jgi:hypothetical protein